MTHPGIEPGPPAFVSDQDSAGATIGHWVLFILNEPGLYWCAFQDLFESRNG
jgi:hypothetical protein